MPHWSLWTISEPTDSQTGVYVIHITRRGFEAARPPPSPSTFLKPHETASPSRAHPPASARGQTIRALPWEDAAARFLQLGFEVARRPASCTRAFPYSPTVARFDPRQAGQTLNHGFPRWPVHKPSFSKIQQSAARFTGQRQLSAAFLPMAPMPDPL